MTQAYKKKHEIHHATNGPTIPKPHDHIMMTQMNMREGIKIFGGKGNDALLKEFKLTTGMTSPLAEKERRHVT